MKRILLVTLLALTVALGCVAVACTPSVEEGFVLYSATARANVFVAENDHEQVHRAAQDLRTDVKRVTGGSIAVSTAKPSGKYAVLVGTVGQSALIDGLIADGKLDEAESIRGKWECYTLKLVEDPCEGVSSALVIAGSDMRGTVYGVYTLSEMMGVSPWYFMADVHTEHRGKLAFSFAPIVSSEPTVKYRGIFINDEYNFTTWAKQYATGTGAPNEEIYGRVFELLLRLKSNTLWPGMHGISTGFYVKKDVDGVSLNAKCADRYGVVIGTSHCEQFLRNNVVEWQAWADKNKNKYGLPDTTGWAQSENPYAAFEKLYDFSQYPEAVTQYWYERLVEAKDFESLITIGMRGVHDEGFQYKGLTDPSFPNRVALIQSVIDTQMELIENVYGADWEDKVQLVYIPYKEAADYYYGVEGGVDYGVKLSLPENVLLMWAEDNYGYLRQTPDPDELEIENGYGNMGIYYHLSYVGNPCVWIWTDLASHGTVYAEMKKAYDTGATGCWVVNVGDIKPVEHGMEYFLQLAYDVDGYGDADYVRFMQERALRDFTADADLAAEIADLVVTFKHCAETYRADFAGKNNMALLSATANGDEAMRLVQELERYYDRANAIWERLPAHKKDAFWQTVAYAIRGEYFAVKRIVYAQRTQTYYKQGRFAAAAWYGEHALLAQDELEADVRYYNSSLSDGKWYGMMNEHIGGAYYGLVTRQELEAMIVRAGASYGRDGVGAVCEGQEVYAEGGTLNFSSLADEERFLDVYSLGSGAFHYTVQCPDFVRMKKEGSVATEERLVVTVDWSKLSASASGEIVVADEFGHAYTFAVKASVATVPQLERTYVMQNGVASIEAEHYSELVAGADGTYWSTVQGLGRSGTGSVKVYPDTVIAPTDNYDTTARIIYRVYAERAGVYYGTLYRIPTLNESGTQNVAIGLAGRTPTVLVGTTKTNTANWNLQVMERIEKLSFGVILQKGANDLVVYRKDPFFAFDKIVLTDKPSADLSYYGIPETFNTISYLGTTVASLPTPSEWTGWTDTDYYHDSFNFGTADALSGRFVHVSATNGVFDQTKGFGFATAAQAQAVQNYYRSDAKTSDERKSFSYGTGKATFSMRAENGTYTVTVTGGDPLSNGLGAVATASVNGVSLWENTEISAGLVQEYGVVVTVTDGVIKLELDGEWILNAIELHPYVDAMAQGGAFLIGESEGYFEAESALEQSDYAYTTASTLNSKAWTFTGGVSGGAVMAGPDNGANHTNTKTFTGCGLHYKVTFEKSGTYYLWVLAKLASPDDDSFHIVWDGAYQYSYNPSSREQGFAWAYTRWSVTVRAGETHTLSIWQREDGAVLDKFWFTTFGSRISGGKSVSDLPPITTAPVRRVLIYSEA